MTTILTITNQKGGVGKTTTVIHLSHGLALAGKRVLIVDLDPQGQSAIALDVEQTPGVFSLLIAEQPPASLIVQARERLSILPGNKKTGAAQITMSVDLASYPMDYIGRALRPVMADYDYIFFDTSPSVGGLQERAMWISKWVLTPTATEFLSIDGLRQTQGTMDALKERGWKGKLLGILPTFYDEQTRESQAAIGELRAAFPQTLLSPIHRATILRECAANGRTAFEMYPRSRATQDYQILTDFVLERT